MTNHTLKISVRVLSSGTEEYLKLNNTDYTIPRLSEISLVRDGKLAKSHINAMQEQKLYRQ